MIRVVITLMVLMASLSTVWAQTKSLYFLNKPESIATPQRLAKFEVQSGEHVRVFLHYKNSGSKTMQFEFQSSKTILGSVGFAFNHSPGIAGSTAAIDFFQNELALQNINLKHKWIPGQTISGIIEFTARQNTQIICKTGDTLNPHTSIGVTHELEHAIKLEIQNTPVQIRFGGVGPRSNKGQYGVKQYITATNASTTTKRIIVYASPRAGRAVITWGVNGIYHNTPMLEAKSRHRLAAFTIKAGQSLQMTTMPAGGIAYPVEFEFAPQTIGNDENANVLPL